MKREEIITDLTNIFRETFNDNSIVLNDNMTANDIEGWDSLTHAIMISEVENKFSVKFKIREIISMKNVGILLDIIERKLN